MKTCLADAQTYAHGSKSRKNALDVCAKQLTSAIYSSLENLTQRSKNIGQGERC